MLKRLEGAIEQINDHILGKRDQVKLAVACLLASGHLLIEDLPGVGKTTLSHLLARTLGLDFNRVQFTSDLLPADILGVSIFERQSEAFRFHPGPIFSQVVLADEINRASPKCQSALLEAMEERQVTIEGMTYPLPEPFFVIATQNPTDQVGTFPLPESQLDRFLMVLTLGYPDRAAERDLLLGENDRAAISSLEPKITTAELIELQQQVQRVEVSEPLVEYLQRIIDATRQSPSFAVGLSPRAGLGLLHAGRAWAMMEGRDFVRPDDIQAVLAAVVNHRLMITGEGSVTAVEHLLEIPIP
ncbi:MAG: MoxR family ATPase [Gammaproteobacteria bacterium]|nr:MoxR family ATPase [Gammaproteobacteria bacterium]